MYSILNTSNCLAFVNHYFFFLLAKCKIYEFDTDVNNASLKDENLILSDLCQPISIDNPLFWTHPKSTYNDKTYVYIHTCKSSKKIKKINKY